MKRRAMSVLLAIVLFSTFLPPISVPAEEWFADGHEHSYYSWVTADPTCTDEGEEAFECDCGDGYTVTLPALGHEFSNGACTRCGAPDPAHVITQPEDAGLLETMPVSDTVSENPKENPSEEQPAEEDGDAEELIPNEVGGSAAEAGDAYTPRELVLTVSKNAKTSINAGDRLQITSTKTVSQWVYGSGAIAPIADNRDVCTVIGTSIGSAKITAALADGKKIVITLTVQDPYLPASVSFAAEQIKTTMYAGGQQSLKEALTPAPAYAKTAYSWKSSNKKIIKVDSEGNVTALKAGTAKITATSKNRKEASVTIKVLPNKVDGMSAKPGKTDPASVAGSWTLWPKSVEIQNGKIVCEFYVLNGTAKKSSAITNLDLSLYAEDSRYLLARQTFSKVKAAVKKNGSKVIQVAFTGSGIKNANYVLPEYGADRIYPVVNSTPLLSMKKGQIPYTATKLREAPRYASPISKSVEAWQLAPTITEIEQTGADKVRLAWSVAAPANCYSVYEVVDGQNVLKKIADTTSAELSGVSAGKHIYTVLPKSAKTGEQIVGQYSAKRSITVMEDWRLAPTITKLEQTGAGKVKLTWSVVSPANYYSV
ncbi:MAG: Ig-like domain-containing protein, partial [Clostridia bacterium]|nr:Ig-like domain-containing protein [Clostridia bacterium]